MVSISAEITEQQSVHTCTYMHVKCGQQANLPCHIHWFCEKALPTKRNSCHTPLSVEAVQRTSNTIFMTPCITHSTHQLFTSAWKGGGTIAPVPGKDAPSVWKGGGTIAPVPGKDAPSVWKGGGTIPPHQGQAHTKCRRWWPHTVSTRGSSYPACN